MYYVAPAQHLKIPDKAVRRPNNRRRTKNLWDPVLGEVRPCKRCGESWPADREFFETSGHGTLNALCRDCYREYRSQRRKAMAATNGDAPRPEEVSVWDQEDIENVGNGLKMVALEQDSMPMLVIVERKGGSLGLITNDDMPWEERCRLLLEALALTIFRSGSANVTRHEYDFPERGEDDEPATE